MKPRILSFLATILIIMFAINSCGKKEPEIKLKEPEFKKYPFKSAVVEYAYSGEASGKMMQYIDYWGAREANEDMSTIKMMGQERKNNTLTIFDQDSLFTVDLTKKEGTRMKNPMWEATIGAFKAMTPDQKKNFANEQMKQLVAQAGAKTLGTEQILGKTCDIYESQGYKQSFWNGILMKMEVDMQGMKMGMVATKFETDVDIPSSKFTAPPDAKINAMDPHQMMGGQQQQPPPDQNAQQSNPHAQQSDPHAGMDMDKEKKKSK